jgi:SAM-dependent methyltransferase
MSTSRQQNLWESEWNLNREQMWLPGQSDLEPPTSVIDFADLATMHFHDRASSDISALDIGCGMGRNAIFLASRFGKVVGIDYALSAVIKAKQLANFAGVEANFVQADAIGTMPFPEDTFGIVLDSFTSTSIQGNENREVFAADCTRILKPGGLLLMRCVSTEDATESALMKSNPGPDVNSSIWPGTIKFQKNYSAQEILNLHKELDLVKLSKYQKHSYKLGKYVQVTNWIAVFEKPLVKNSEAS